MRRQGFYMIFFIPLFSACLESPIMTKGIVNGKEKPTVETETTNPILEEGKLFFQGKITDTGKSETVETGFYWSTDSKDPGDKDNIAKADVNGDNIFSYELENASGDQIYYWRAYASNIYGVDRGKVNSCATPPIWKEKESLNTYGRGDGAVFMLNDKIYMTCGNSATGALRNETWEYSIASDRWFKLMDFPGDSRIYPVAFTIGNFAFVGTGQRSAGVLHNDFYRFDNTADPDFSWTDISVPNDLVARYKAVAFSINGKGYVIGGLSVRESLNDVWQFDLEKNSWQKKNDLPFKFYGGISICDNNQAFIGFGEVPGTDKILWKYDEKIDSWYEFATLPEDVKKIYSGVIIRNTIYIVDGKNIIWACDMSNEIKTWKKKADLPVEFINDVKVSGYQLMLTTSKSNSIYVGLGFTQLLYEYSPLWDNLIKPTSNSNPNF